MTTKIKLFCTAVLLALSTAVAAQQASGLSVDFPDSRTIAVQAKVEKLFDAGKYERAFFIYRNELAPLGDKYAQYMIGYMYQTGLGVDEDAALASAWYRLAAERETPEFVVVRDRQFRGLSEEEVAKSDREYQAMRAQYSDLAVLMASIKRNYSELETRTGSRVRGEASPVTVIENRLGRSRSGDAYYGNIREQLEARLKMVIELGDFQDIVPDIDRVNLNELERRVKARLEFGADEPPP